MENYVIYQDCAIAAQFEKEKKKTYSMNPFIEDEMRDYQSTEETDSLLYSWTRGNLAAA